MNWTQRYVEHALTSFEPCETCPPEQREAYERIQGLVGVAEDCYRMAYKEAARLSRSVYGSPKHEDNVTLH
ncbi:MAG: hypothetical protein HY513_02375 [Candidatus Aenigmarchaeota archaeon]|nr:hypothetical protein [Candidatus Aenigmarchaeota archaeon]